MNKFFYWCFLFPLFINISCGFYSFTGASIPAGTETFQVNFFENLAANKPGSIVEPGLDQDFTIAMQDLFLNQTNLIVKRPNQLKKLNKIVSKTLIIRGKNDKLSSNIMNNELNKKIKYSVYTEIKNSSHFVMLEKPKTFNKIITNFLF